ncbi:unnamed protein product [Amoebophrya sp. A120]|nr:unnamed protein product [Amoebophrya sp. A120]|eukprot:GSA120T00020091001.1
MAPSLLTKLAAAGVVAGSSVLYFSSLLKLTTSPVTLVSAVRVQASSSAGPRDRSTSAGRGRSLSPQRSTSSRSYRSLFSSSSRGSGTEFFDIPETFQCAICQQDCVPRPGGAPLCLVKSHFVDQHVCAACDAAYVAYAARSGDHNRCVMCRDVRPLQIEPPEQERNALEEAVMSTASDQAIQLERVKYMAYTSRDDQDKWLMIWFVNQSGDRLPGSELCLHVKVDDTGLLLLSLSTTIPNEGRALRVWRDGPFNLTKWQQKFLLHLAARPGVDHSGSARITSRTPTVLATTGANVSLSSIAKRGPAGKAEALQNRRRKYSCRKLFLQDFKNLGDSSYLRAAEETLNHHWGPSSAVSTLGQWMLYAMETSYAAPASVANLQTLLRRDLLQTYPPLAPRPPQDVQALPPHHEPLRNIMGINRRDRDQ